MKSLATSARSSGDNGRSSAAAELISTVVPGSDSRCPAASHHLTSKGFIGHRCMDFVEPDRFASVASKFRTELCVREHALEVAPQLYFDRCWQCFEIAVAPGFHALEGYCLGTRCRGIRRARALRARRARGNEKCPK
jgi:hypothetical protein